LDNAAFVARAPAAVVDKERRRLAEANDDAARLRAELVRLG